MSDAALRSAERNHDDPNKLAVALRRAGRQVPYDLKVRLTTLFGPPSLNKQGLPEFRHKTTGMIFVMLPAGEFMMGPSDQAVEGGGRQSRRTFSEPFLMAKYPWTGKEWFRVTGEFPSHFPSRTMVGERMQVYTPEGQSIENEAGDVPAEVRLSLPDNHGRTWGDHPVESVSWDRCRQVEDWINRVDFARQFNAAFKTSETSKWMTWLQYVYGDASAGVDPAKLHSDGEPVMPVFGRIIFNREIEALYQAWLWNKDGERVGFQLPTESMWEYAARAGTTTRYPNGDTEEDLRKIAWFGGEWDEGHKAVGLLEPNNWGLHDNCGNIFEWTRCQWHDTPEASPENGFLAHGEVRPDPTNYLDDQEIAQAVARFSSTVAQLPPTQQSSCREQESQITNSNKPHGLDSGPLGESSSPDPGYEHDAPEEGARRSDPTTAVSDQLTGGLIPDQSASATLLNDAAELTDSAIGQLGDVGDSDPTHDLAGDLTPVRSIDRSYEASTTTKESLTAYDQSVGVGASVEVPSAIPAGETGSAAWQSSHGSPSDQGGGIDRYADYVETDDYSLIGSDGFADDATDPTQPAGPHSAGATGVSSGPYSASNESPISEGLTFTGEQEHPGEPGSPGFTSDLGGRSIEIQPALTSTSPEKTHLSDTLEIPSSTQDSYIRPSCPSLSLPSSSADNLTEEAAGPLQDQQHGPPPAQQPQSESAQSVSDVAGERGDSDFTQGSILSCLEFRSSPHHLDQCHQTCKSSQTESTTSPSDCTKIGSSRPQEYSDLNQDSEVATGTGSQEAETKVTSTTSSSARSLLGPSQGTSPIALPELGPRGERGDSDFTEASPDSLWGVRQRYVDNSLTPNYRAGSESLADAYTHRQEASEFHSLAFSRCPDRSVDLTTTEDMRPPGTSDEGLPGNTRPPHRYGSSVDLAVPPMSAVAQYGGLDSPPFFLQSAGGSAREHDGTAQSTSSILEAGASVNATLPLTRSAPAGDRGDHPLGRGRATSSTMSRPYTTLEQSRSDVQSSLPSSTTETSSEDEIGGAHAGSPIAATPRAHASSTQDLGSLPTTEMVSERHGGVFEQVWRRAHDDTPYSVRSFDSFIFPIIRRPWPVIFPRHIDARRWRVCGRVAWGFSTGPSSSVIAADDAISCRYRDRGIRTAFRCR